MPLQITTTGGGIKFIFENTLPIVVPKSSIQAIKYCGTDMIKVERLGFGQDIYFRWRDVSAPVSADATALVNLIGGWL